LSRHVTALNRAVEQWLLGIIKQRRVFRAPRLGRDALREEVGIERRVRGQRQDLAVVRIHGDNYAAFGDRLLQLIFRGLLQIEIDCRYQILAGFGRDDLNLFLNVSAAIDNHFAIAIRPRR